MIESMLLWNRKYTVYIDMSPLKKKKTNNCMSSTISVLTSYPGRDICNRYRYLISENALAPNHNASIYTTAAQIGSNWSNKKNVDDNSILVRQLNERTVVSGQIFSSYNARRKAFNIRHSKPLCIYSVLNGTIDRQSVHMCVFYPTSTSMLPYLALNLSDITEAWNRVGRPGTG